MSMRDVVLASGLVVGLCGAHWLTALGLGFLAWIISFVSAGILGASTMGRINVLTSIPAFLVWYGLGLLLHFLGKWLRRLAKK
jgi:hypothetical protein